MGRNEFMEKNEQCIYAKKCGGCDYQGISYSKQLEMKEKQFKKLFSDNSNIKKIIGAQNPYNYRNKIHGVFCRDKNGSIFTGIYQAGTHNAVCVKDCLIEDVRAHSIMSTLCYLAKSFKLQVYDEDRQTGLLRHVLVRTGYNTGEILVVLVLASPVFPSKNNFMKELIKRHPEITSVVLNVNDRRTNMVLGEKNIILYGRGYIEDVLCGLRFRISPNSFYQINPKQTEVLYGKAIELAAFTGRERIIDAYCGIGTIGMTAASKVKEVIGIELNKSAVSDAKQNAGINNIRNIRFVNDDATKYMVRMASAGESVDVVLMDPPRSGTTKDFIDSVKKLAPKKVIYISCNPETLARDLVLFEKSGYKTQVIQPLDMFPFTSHTEAVCLLVKTKAR